MRKIPRLSDIQYIVGHSHPWVFDGVHYQDRHDPITDALGFCGCGMPEEAVCYVLGGLDLVAVYQDGVTPYDEWVRLRDKQFPSDGAAYFFWYWLDHLGLTEHGGSVPGWLSYEGHGLRDDLRTIVDEWDAEDSEGVEV